MAYTYTNTEDTHKILAEETITVTTVYKGEFISEEVLEEEEVYTIPVSKDGEYVITVVSESDTNIITFTSVKNIQNSIIKDTMSLLCGCGCNDCVDNSNNCLSKEAKNLLKYQNIFNKLYSYQYYYTTIHSNNLIQLTTYLSKGFSDYKCDIQKTINSILQEECIEGLSKVNSKVFKLHLFLFWSALYFTEKHVHGVEIIFLNKKFFYDKIVKCMCDICLDINQLESLFLEEIDVDLIYATYYSFQYNSVADTIDNIDKITTPFLSDNGESHREQDLLEGKEFTLPYVGRFGFVLTGANISTYSIEDILGNDVTNIVFNIEYDALNNTVYYVSKEHFTPSSIYYKFIKN